MIITLRSTLALVTAASVLTACGKKDEAPAVDTTAAMAPVPAPPAAVTSTELGKRLGPNSRVADTTSVFARRDTVYLSVITENTTPTSTLMARWKFQNGQVVDSTSQTVAAAGSGSQSVTEFHVANPRGWPAGKYAVDVLLDGQQVASRSFEVRR